MDSLKRVVKVEKTTSSESLNLRRIFGPGSCGEIRAIHASGFIEFTDAASAERAVALKLDMPGVRVFNVASQPRLVEQYRVVNPFAFAAAGEDLQSNAAGGQFSGMSRPEHVRPPPRPASVSETGLLLQALKSSDDPISRLSESTVGGETRQPTLSLPSSHTLSASPPSVPLSSSSAINPFPCIENHILMRLCGENITLDLRSLAGDPATVIQLLKLTSSERGNWLIVAAHFRRTGSAQGAKDVVNAMLEALKQFNIPQSDLKPAFLLLSGCETDLGKIAKSKGDSVKASEHYSNAQKWLHKVYGTSLPSDASESLAAGDPKRTRAATPPRAPASTRSRIDNRARPPSPDYRILEREIQSLRDRHTHDTNIISEMRSSKRKLQDTIEIERDVRRRLQRELNDAVKERNDARRTEALALEKVTREVDWRRKAERAKEERGLQKHAESGAAECAVLQRSGYVDFPRITPMAPSAESFAVHHHRISF